MTTNLLPDKYQVYKVISEGSETERLSSEKLPTGSYFVLRKQDMLAGHALWAYVNVLGTASDLLIDSDPPRAADLRILADQIADLAENWDHDQSDKKLPD